MVTKAAGVRVRPFAAADYARYVEIYNATYPHEPLAVEEAREQDRDWDAARFCLVRLVAEDERGEVAGWGEVRHVTQRFHPRKYWLDLVVDPARRGRGVGSALYARLFAELQARQAIQVRADAREAAPAVQFLTQRGFVEVDRVWQSRLYVDTFDFDGFKDAEPRVLGQGISFTTFQEELARDPDAARKAYALHVAVSEDVPALDPYTAPPFDNWAKWMLAHRALLDGYLLVKDGDEFVGSSALWRHEGSESHWVNQGLTGVRREYRGRGIAMALKVRGVRFAQQYGAREIRTGNNARNQAMLRVNEALGFVRDAAWIELA